MSRPPSGDQWVIAVGDSRVVIVELGGGVREYVAGDRAVLDGYGVEEMCTGGAGQVLAPWPNRVRDGRWSWRDADQQLPLTEPAAANAIHGLVRWRPWILVARTPDTVRVQCQIDPQPGYPGSVLLETVWSVSDRGLRAEHSARNTGAAPTPFGLGVHPYLVVPGVAVDDLLLEVPAETALRTDERGLPVGEYPVAGAPVDYRAGRQIGSATLDTAFTGGVSHARLSTRDGGGVELSLGDGFRWVQVYTGDTLPIGRRRRSVAVEPMTCPPDALNSGRDLVVLEPDESWTGSWTLRPLQP